MNKLYTISAVTPEEGRVVYETLDESKARQVHSNLLGRQTNPNDMTHDVKVSVSYTF